MFDKSTYDKEYQKANYMTIVLRLNKEKDADLINILSGPLMISKQAYIKKILRDHFHN